MKKSIAILLAVLMLIGLCACGKKATDEEASTSEVGQSELSHETPSEEKITGILCVVRENGDQVSHDFSFYGGTATPERIAAGLTGWTGLKFRVSSEIDETAKTIHIDWLGDSSFATGQIPDKMRDEFTFSDTETMRWFMLNSMTASLLKNLGDYAVYYTVDGEDIHTIGLSDALSSEKAYTETDDAHILIKP